MPIIIMERQVLFVSQELFKTKLLRTLILHGEILPDETYPPKKKNKYQTVTSRIILIFFGSLSETLTSFLTCCNAWPPSRLDVLSTFKIKNDKRYF